VALLAGACENAAAFDEIDRVSMTIENRPSPLEGKDTKFRCSSARDTAAYEAAFTIAIACRYGKELLDGISPTPLGEKLMTKREYGCFCGPGNGGIDTLPLDGVDKCCKQHDERLWDLCQNLPAREGAPANLKGDGCDCYTKTPEPKCDNEKKTIYFPNWDKLDACERACANDMEQLNVCVRRHDLKIDNVGVDRENACQPGDPPSAGTKENPVVYPPEEYKECRKKKQPELEPPKPPAPTPTPVPLPLCPNRRLRSSIGDETSTELCNTEDGIVTDKAVLDPSAGGTNSVSLSD
jgi:hypothetical protein